MQSAFSHVFLHSTCIVFLLALSIVTIPTDTAKGGSITQGILSYEDILRGNYVNVSMLEEHLHYLTINCTPRVTGYPGFYRAQEYVYQKFLEYNLTDVQYQWYNITIPEDLGGTLSVYAPEGTLLKTFEVNPLWPNSVQASSTLPGGIKAKLFYAEKGDYANYDSYITNESIVLLDFNTDYNWLKAMDLGAKAVVFIEPDSTCNFQSLTKYLYSTPIYAPRVYLRRKDAGDLLQLLNQYGGMLDAKLESRMKWQVKKVANIIGFSPGTTLKDQWIVFFAHYDAWSVVPSLTEGATEACGISVLLETIRFYTNISHARSIMFVAFSGYGQGLYGARYFMDSLLVGDSFPQVLNPNQTSGQGIFLFAGMDLSPETDTVGPLGQDDFYYVGGLGSYSDFPERVLRPLFYLEGGIMDKVKSSRQTVYGTPWSPPPFEMISSAYQTNPTMIACDASVFVLGRTVGRFTYRTTYAWFDRRYTPLDTLSRIEEVNNLKPQMEFILCTSYDLLRTTNIKPSEDISPYSRIHWEGWSASQFYRVMSQAVIYNTSTAKYEPLPNAIVQVQVAATERVFASRATWFETADDKGYFIVSGAAAGAPGRAHCFYPYLLNETTSKILYAPDFGRYGAVRFPNRILFFGLDKNPFFGSLTSPLTFVAFRCGTLQIFNMDASLGPSTITLSGGWVLTWDMISYRPYAQVDCRINDPVSHAAFETYGFQQEPIGPFETDSFRPVTVFVPGKTPAEIILSYAGELSPVALLHNSSVENPLDGYGYMVEEGKTLDLVFSPFVAAKELNYLNGERIKGMVSHIIYTTGTSYVDDANNELELAKNALKNLNYSGYYDHTVSALGIERSAYTIVKSDLYSVLSSTLTIFIFILLFAYLAERLFFSSIHLKKRAVGIALFTILGLIPLIILHPGFTMASNVYVSIYGIIVLVFIGMVWALLIGYSLGSFRRLREKLIGKHFIQVSRITSLMTGMGLGLSYMKKRRLRASLTLVTLIIVSACIVMFTSVTAISFVKPSLTSREVGYAGVFIREYLWNPLNPRFLDYLNAKLGEVNVLPRIWLYARMPTEYAGYLVKGSNGTALVIGCYGLTFQEGSYAGWTNYLKDGLWFQEEDYDWCIISEGLANKIGAKVGDVVTLMGSRMRVRGIIYEATNVRRLDGDISSLKDPAGRPPENRFLAPQNMIYVPYRWAWDHGGKIHEIITLGGDVEKLGLELAKEINLDFYVANRTGISAVEFYSKRTGFMISGYELVTLPLILAALTVLNLMLGAVYERIKEITIFSTIGLSPSDVGMMFLSESISYGVIGVILGYIAGIVGLSILLTYRALPPGMYPNYSSGFIAQTIGIIILIVILSSLFPFFKSSKLVTPSLERKWKVTTKPLGDQWNIPTPFFFGSEPEANGFIEYMNEYFGAYTIESPGFPFATHSIAIKSGAIDGIPYRSLVIELHLAPFSANVNQTLDLMIRNIDGTHWTAEIIAKRRTGDLRSWVSSNRKFLDVLRKQFISWRILSPSEKERYIKDINRR